MNTNQIARVAALIGEPARTGMLLALMDGRALTARELAEAGRITAATASRHLALLLEAGLLRVEQQGRHRYHRLASADVARVLEGLMQLSAQPPLATPRVPTGPRDAALRQARTCYDHIAGRLGVAISIHLQAEGALLLDDAAGAQVTARLEAVLRPLGIEGVDASGARGQRPLCRPCLDWSERRMHLAGRLGAMLCSHSLARGWLTRSAGSRALSITPSGAVVLREWLGLGVWAEVVAA
ncbi:ArsR/SmtB family transcription factor [Variovorax sp. HJSM1_2]|uniref:ArsR/SmtB family transcription factor n=1 Tax=Variovorax sp. HJSM1_2 TaxID=3366263 RepID=UPI003BCE0ACB